MSNSTKTSRNDASRKSKHGIELWVYPSIGDETGLVYIEVHEGHFEEFYDKVSTFTYYIIEGSGAFYLNGELQNVESGDVISIPPKTKIYYKGSMKMILITTPAWSAENEVHVRDIPRAGRIPEHQE